MCTYACIFEKKILKLSTVIKQYILRILKQMIGNFHRKPISMTTYRVEKRPTLTTYRTYQMSSMLANTSSTAQKSSVTSRTKATVLQAG